MTISENDEMNPSQEISNHASNEIYNVKSIPLAIAPKFPALLSIICSIMIIRRVLRSPNRRNDIYHRLICGLSCTDVICSTAYFLGTWLVPYGKIGGFGQVYGAIGNHATCSLSGFLTQMAIASPLYNGSLSLYYLFTINYNWAEYRIRKLEKWLHIVPLGYAVASSSIALALEMYGNVEWLCWIKPDPRIVSTGGGDDDVAKEDGATAATFSNAQKNFVIFQWVFLFGPLWVTILFVSVVFFLLYRKVRENERKMEKYKFSAANIYTNARAIRGVHARGAASSVERNNMDDNLVTVGTEAQEDIVTIPPHNDASLGRDHVIMDKNHEILSTSMQHDDDGWRTLRKLHTLAVNDKLKQLYQQEPDQQLRNVLKSDDVNDVKDWQNPTHSYNDQATEITETLAIGDNHNQDEHCAGKYFHGHVNTSLEIDDNDDDEDEKDVKLTLDEEMAIKDAANKTTMMQQQDICCITDYDATDDIRSVTAHHKTTTTTDREQDELLSSDVIGKRKSVTFSSTTMPRKASISSNYSMRSSFQSQISSESTTSSMMGISQSAAAALKKKKKYYIKASKSRQIAIQGILYSCAFYFTWFFPTLQRITEVAVNRNYYVIQVLDSVLLPLQGVFNFATYIRPRFVAFRNNNPQIGFWKCLWKVTYDNS